MSDPDRARPSGVRRPGVRAGYDDTPNAFVTLDRRRTIDRLAPQAGEARKAA